MTNAKQDFIDWVLSGECEMCFPYWEYEGVSPIDVINWAEELEEGERR